MTNQKGRQQQEAQTRPQIVSRHWWGNKIKQVLLRLAVAF